jgi:hypothetical protein
LLLVVAGCEDSASMYTASSLGYGMMAQDPTRTLQQQQAAAALGTIMATEGQRTHEMDVAREGRSQVTINNNTTQPSSSESSIGKIWNGVNEKMGDGSTYTGPLIVGSDGKSWPYGHGAYTFADGTKYDGEFKDGKLDGRGVLTYPDGRKHDGEWKGGEMNGRVVITSPEGGRVDGVFKDGKLDGQAMTILSDGTDISGEWRDGKPWKTKGTYVWPDGTKYVGEWNRDGSKSGGTITWTDGRIYEGDWKGLEGKPDLPDGQGTMTWPDGPKYTGDFREGKMQGFGKMTYPDGKVEEGAWRDAKFVGGGTPSSSSSSKTGFVSVSADDQTFEVFVDGAFVGNTPAKLKLSEGTHVIEVKKPGYKDYKKEIKVTEGCELTLRAVMEKN